MTRAEIIAALRALERDRDERIEVWRVVFEADGTPAEQIYRGALLRPPDSKKPHSGD